jgi:DUF1680 family protein
MPVERDYADPRLKADVGCVALQRGPIIYCLEGAENGNQVRDFSLPRSSAVTARFEQDLLGGIVTVHAEALAITASKDGKPVTQHVQFQAVPYWAWDNRQPGPMVVWLPER